MRLFVYEYVFGLTRDYHSGGGVTIITDREPEEVLREVAYELEEDPGVPVYVGDVDTDEEQVFIFPDAGCC